MFVVQTVKSTLGVIDNYIRDFDIISLCETKTDNIPDDAFPGYTSFSLQKIAVEHQYGGIHGISLIVKDSLAPYVTIIKGTFFENVLWSKLDNDDLSIHHVIGCIYIPHENSILNRALSIYIGGGVPQHIQKGGS